MKAVSHGSWNEWLFIKHVFVDLPMSQRMIHLQQGLDIVSMWRSRGQIALSIDLTADLLDVFSKDPVILAKNMPDDFDTHSRTLLSNEDLVRLYSICLIRSVNGITEPGQQGVFTRSVLGIATEIGLPGWIVELRHESAHGHMPPLSVLRRGGEYMYGWYVDHYWTPQLDALHKNSARCFERFKRPDEVALTFWGEFFAPLVVDALLNTTNTNNDNTAEDPTVSMSTHASTSTPASEPVDNLAPGLRVKAEWLERVAALPPRLLASAVHALLYRGISALAMRSKEQEGEEEGQGLSRAEGGISEREECLVRFLEELVEKHADVAGGAVCLSFFSRHPPQGKSTLPPRLLSLLRRIAQPVGGGEARDRRSESKAVVTGASGTRKAVNKEPSTGSKKKRAEVEEMEAFVRSFDISPPAKKKIKNDPANPTPSSSATVTTATTTNSPSYPIVPTPTIIPPSGVPGVKYADVHMQSLQSGEGLGIPQVQVRVCLDMPLWSGGVAPGDFDPPPFYLLQPVLHSHQH
eukprot:gene31541-38123_t